jgi:UDP-GlcNAc:undecaprenyl-phosphate GlcNAc-1-phosphate transferase
MPPNALGPIAAAAPLSAVLTFLLVRFSLRLRLVAQPRLDRWHKTPTPNTGGLAVFLTCALLYTLFAWGRYPMIAASAAAIALIGFLDDRVQLRPLVKFLAQSTCVIVVMASGVVFRATPWEAVNLALTFLWIAGITNAFNLIDNMDGLCAGVAVIISASRLWFAIETGDPGTALISALLCGSFLGFLAFNYRPAKIFMGDCGSMLAGFTLGALALASPVPRTRVFVSAIFFPALTFLYPIFDTVLVSILRRAAGRPITVGGRDHSSHRLVSLGLSEGNVVWLLWGLTALGSLAGLVTYSMPFGVVGIGFLLVTGVAVLGVFLGTLPAYIPPDTALIRSTWFRRRIPTLRAGTTLVVDVLLSGVALLSAFLVRWDQGFPGAHAHEFLISLPVVMLGYALASLSLRTFNLGWRWFGAPDLIQLAKCVLLGLTLSMFVIWMAGMRGYSRGVTPFLK